jgi:hypothetical protein
LDFTFHFTIKFKKMNKSLLVFMLLLFSNINAICQIPDKKVFDTKSIMATSPDAAILARFGDIPIGHYTGTADISIPIYTIKEAGLEIPIILRYHSSGIKVEDEAGWIGLGWSLEASGSIIQSVNGKEDDLDNLMQYDPAGYDFLKQDMLLGSYSDKYTDNQVQGVDYPGIDYAKVGYGQPDFYYCNFPGFSGKFYINKENNNEVVFIKKTSSVTVTRNGSNWVITTLDGNKFYFTIRETVASPTTVEYTGYTWKLSKIVLHNGREINFEYSSGFYQSNSFSQTWHEQYPFGLGALGIESYTSPTYHTIKYLKKIVTQNLSIEFILEDRDDLFGETDNDDIANNGLLSTKRLKSILIKEPNSNRNIKLFNFGYEYFAYSQVGGTYLNANSQTLLDKMGKRLKLISLQENGYNAEGQSQPISPYKFFYEESISLPLKTSFARDFWGYYNGKDGNTSLLPDFSYYRFSGFPEYQSIPINVLNSYGSAANRSVNINTIQAGILKKIQYPTGGYSSFNYESNSFSNFNYPDLDHISNLSVTGSVEDKNIGTDIYSKQFTVPNTLTGHFTATINRGPNTNTTFDDMLPSTITLTRVGNGGSNITPIKTWQMIDNLAHRQDFAADGVYTWAEDILLDSIPNTYYVLIANLPDALGSQNSSNNSASVSAQYSFASTGNSSLKLGFGAGLRIKSVQNYTSDAQLASQKSIEYVENGQTTGLLMSPLKHFYSRELNFSKLYLEGIVHAENTTANIWFVSSNSYIPFSDAANGNLVGYSKVQEINQGDESNNGFHNWYFHNFQSNTKINNPDIPDLRNGLLLREDILNSTGDTIQKVKYTYVEKEAKFLRGFKIFDNNIGDMPQPFTPGYGHVVYPPGKKYSVYSYPNNAQWFVLDKKNTSNYFNGIVVNNQDEYNYNSLGQITLHKTVNSKNEEVKTNTIYPIDIIGSPSGIEQAMRDQSLHNYPLEDYVTVNNNETTRTKNKFKILTNGQVVLRSVETSFKGGALKEDIEFATYGDFKKPLMTVEDGKKVVHLWSFNSLNPIAKIDNADISTVAAVLGEESIINFMRNPNPSKENINSFLAPLRTNEFLKDALITTYTYEPLVGMTSQTDPKGMTTYYEYDSFQRLQNIKDQGGSIVKNYAYNYANNQTVAPVVSYQSQERSQPYTKSDCPSGQYGTSVTYTVEAKKYSSTISQADADAKASSDLAANGQKNANLLGGCSLTAPPVVFYNVIKTEYRTRNNCPSGQSSAPVLYTVAANTYSAPTQAAADQLALDDIAANAQAYANSTGSCSIGGGTTTYYNVALTIPSVRNNCTSGLNGSPVNYTVAAGTYSSTISQVDADQKAMADVNANGQAYANTYGSCTTAPPGGFNFIVSTPVPSFLKFIFSYASTGGSVEYEIWGQDKTILIPGSGTGSVTIIDVDSQPSTFSFNLNGVVMSGSGTTTFNNVSFNGPVTFTAQRTSPYYFYNQAKTGQAAKLCPTGQTGERVTYTVPAGKHASLISMADANQMAQNDINANVQAYANANGGCALNLTLNYSTPVDTTTRISINDFAQSKHYVVSGSGTLTDISPWDVIIDVVPTPLFGVQYFYSLGSFPVTSYSSYTTFGTVRLTSGMTLSVTSNQVFKNSGVSVTRTKDNCPSGQLGSAVHYFVGPNVYSSTISQADADAKAQADIDANAQAYANANGTCTPITYYNVQQSVSKTRNDCDPGYIGSEETFVVYAGNYSSQISQADADAKAMAYANAQAQNYANENGTCNLPVVYYATPKFATKTRNNCAGGLAGSQVTYGSHYGGQTYTSLISQADADAKAQANVDANAQNYANAVGTCGVVYRNTFQTAAFTRNNCGSGLRGEGIIYYAVQANTYTSTISQADANAQALADIAANGQNNANNLGNCVSTTSSISYNNPSGGTFRIQISNVLTGTVTNYTITASSGTISGIPSGNSYVSVFDLNEWEFTAAFNGSTTIAGGGSSETPATQIHFSMINLKGTMVLELNY